MRLLNAIDEGRYSFDELREKIADPNGRDEGKIPSTRSLRRYLTILEEAGFPWYFDRSKNTYSFADGYSLKRLELSSKELFGLVALRSLGASLGGSIGSYIDEVTDKLVGSARGAKGHVETKSPVTFRLPEIRLDEQGERAFELLSSAERSSRSVAFEYRDNQGRTSRRSADPYGFIVSGGRVYCVAYDHARKDMRTFAIDNITSPDVLGQTFTKPSDFDIESFAARSISGVMHGDDTVEARVHFSPRVAKAAIAARAVAEQHILRNADGTVEIAYSVADLDELIRWVLGWGAQAEIIAPREARKRAQAMLKEIIAAYNFGGVDLL